MKLLDIKPSPLAKKKYRARFSDGSHTDFGAAGYSDFTKHNDEERKQRYLARHKKNETWSEPSSAGSLSRYVLWNKPTLTASINDYKKKFNL